MALPRGHKGGGKGSNQHAQKGTSQAQQHQCAAAAVHGAVRSTLKQEAHVQAARRPRPGRQRRSPVRTAAPKATAPSTATNSARRSRTNSTWLSAKPTTPVSASTSRGSTDAARRPPSTLASSRAAPSQRASLRTTAAASSR